MKCFDKVTVNVKALHVDEPTTVSGGYTKQDIVVADSVASARLTLWQADIGKISEGSCYRLNNLVVCTYQQRNYLSMPKEGATIVEIDNIGEVVEDSTGGSYETVEDAEVIGVQHLEAYPTCIACKHKVELKTETLGICIICNMHQRTEKCQKKSAKLVLSSGTDYYNLTAFGTNVIDIAEKDVAPDSLLSASPFTLTYDGSVITSVPRS